MVDDEGIRGLEGVDELRRPEVLNSQQQRRAVQREVVADLVGVLGAEGAGLGDGDADEAGAGLSVKISDREMVKPLVT